MIDNISVNAQSSIKIKFNDKYIYFDPFKIEKISNDASYIFITHSHYDHFSKEDILKVMNSSTKIIVPYDLEDEVKNLGFNDVLLVKPNESYSIDDISFNTVPAYNKEKPFHKKESNWVGYIINLNNENIYVSGDTDVVEELNNITCDIALICIGGTYTCDYIEASNLINKIKPKFTIPIHYSTVVGSVEDAYKFKELVSSSTDVKILIK